MCKGVLMAVSVIVGAQWGDEGKGKIVDLLSEKVDIVARYQGGPNAGHTVVVNAGKAMEARCRDEPFPVVRFPTRRT